MSSASAMKPQMFIDQMDQEHRRFLEHQRFLDRQMELFCEQQQKLFEQQFQSSNDSFNRMNQLNSAFQSLQIGK